MRSFLCRASEWLKLQKLFWLVVFFFAAVGFLVSLGATIDRLAKNTGWAWLDAVAGVKLNPLRLNEDLEGMAFSTSLFLLGLSAPFLLVVCRQRQAVLDALAKGYWNNFLRHFLLSDYQVFILPPTRAIADDTTAYESLMRRKLEKEYGIELVESDISAANRKAYVVCVDGKALPVAIDFCRNLAVLDDILRREADIPLVRGICRTGEKFDYLVGEFFEALQSQWSEINSLSHLFYKLDPNGDRRLEAAIKSTTEGSAKSDG